ncbi:hypothetical protein A3860_14715 [Niastella vici]|uniref:Uncharacterized protein n=1 Tax=Niastella vici TaxID=1703345 RepID=A0A1V9G5E9_9BACT|nr:hypothetical protein [Niastella vici]OQP65843.1 hypothetical protein A3860_14715 [Niastella vici]
MEPENFEKIEAGSLEIVLNEFAEEQKSHAKSIGDLVIAVNVVTGKFIQLEEKLDKPKEVTIHTNTKPIEEILKKAATQMQLIVSGQPKSITKKYQLLLFPEQDANLFYKIVFGRWFMWLAIIVFLRFLYLWAVHWSDNNKQVRMEQLQDDRYTNAWNYLYKGSRKEVRRLMDSAWIKSDNK